MSEFIRHAVASVRRMIREADEEENRIRIVCFRHGISWQRSPHENLRLIRSFLRAQGITEREYLHYLESDGDRD